MIFTIMIVSIVSALAYMGLVISGEKSLPLGAVLGWTTCAVLAYKIYADRKKEDE